MLVVNNIPANVTLNMDIHLMPGTNDVPNKVWDRYRSDKRFHRSFKSKVERGIISLIDKDMTRENGERVTMKMVQQTYDVRILEDWLETSKGRLKGEIRKQIEKCSTDDQ